MLAVLFNLGANRFAMASRTVVEVLPLVALTPIPQCPKIPPDPDSRVAVRPHDSSC